MGRRGKGKGKGKKGDKGKGKGDGKGGKTKKKGDGAGGGGGGGTGGPPADFNICRDFLRTGKCPRTEKGETCKWKHVSRQQCTKIFGFDIMAGQPAGGSGGGGGGGKDGKGKGKSKKPKSPSKATPAEGDQPSAAAELQRLKSRAMYCAAYIKGNCAKGNDCKFPHVDPAVAEEIKRASAIFKKEDKEKRAGSRSKTGAGAST